MLRPWIKEAETRTDNKAGRSKRIAARRMKKRQKIFNPADVLLLVSGRCRIERLGSGSWRNRAVKCHFIFPLLIMDSLGWNISDLVPMLKILLLQVSPVSDVSQPPSFLLLDFCFLTAAGLYSVGFFESILTSSASQLIFKKIHNMKEFLDWPKRDLSSHRCWPAAPTMFVR